MFLQRIIIKNPVTHHSVMKYMNSKCWAIDGSRRVAAHLPCIHLPCISSWKVLSWFCQGRVWVKSII